ncbi:MAG: hypothetical protein IPH97_06405 [Ignavibacteriales bacterium]|nr:hypothetical protein [Ignavibacteriales bacterium]
MNYTDYKIIRDDLYEKVWTKPMVEIAKEYEVSDKAIAKICDKLNVPVPGVGYWQKLEAGEKLERKRLPDMPPTHPTEHTIRKNEPSYEFEISEEVNALIEKEKNPASKIIVQDKRGSTHILIRRTEQSLEKSYRYSGMLCSQQAEDILKISVSPIEKGRVFRILNTLISELEGRGYLVYIDKSFLCVRIFGVNLKFSLNEKMKQVRLKTESPYSRQYDLVPSGILALSIEDFYSDYPLLRNFLDIKSVKLENRLNEFIIALLIASQAYIAQEKHWEEKRKVYQEEERKRNAIIQEIENEKKKLQELKKNIKKFHSSNLIREYIARYKMKLLDETLAPDKKQEIIEYIEWAQKQADRLDPFIESPVSILDNLKNSEEEDW